MTLEARQNDDKGAKGQGAASVTDATRVVFFARMHLIKLVLYFSMAKALVPLTAQHASALSGNSVMKPFNPMSERVVELRRYPLCQ
jgi:hypothetical protein